jgi:catechol 2,3-dioxygenase-like lactoylglutathione lyase family enzyme
MNDTTASRLVTGTDFVTVPTQDFEAAEAFYGGVLGLPLSKRWGRMPAAEFETGTLTLAVMQSDAFGMEFRPSGSAIALHVDDVPAAREQLEAQGVTFKGDIIDSGVCLQAIFADPDGNTLILHHRYAPPPA